MVSWTCQRVVLNWPMFCSRGVSRLRDATVRSRVPGDGNISPWCVPGRQSVASFALHVSQKAPRTGKAPLPGNISPPCIQNELTLARFARHVSEKPCKSPSEDASREYLARKEPFCCTDPSNHARRANLAIPGCFVWELRARRGARRGEGCRRSACGSLCARRRGAFAGSSHAASSCPRSRARCSCCCACPRVRRARCPPPPREARTFRGALCEVSAFASRRWVCLSPFTRRLYLVRSFRGGARC